MEQEHDGEEVALVEQGKASLHDLLQQKLEQAFHKQTSTVIIHDIAKIVAEHSPIDLAYAAFRLPPHARPLLYENLTRVEQKIEFVINTDSNTRVALLRHVDDAELKELFDHMPPDEAVEVLEALSERRFRKIVDMLDGKKAQRIREIKKHQRNTAGRLMTNEFFAFRMEVTIGAVASYIRDNPGIDLTAKIFVLNGDDELQGFVPARNLIVNCPSLPLRQVMRPVLHKVLPEATREEVVDLVERYKIAALPVVDQENRMLGVITYEDVLDAVEDIADETIASMAGTTEKVSEPEPLVRRFLARAPWLVVTLCAGLVNMGVISSFQMHFAGMMAFAFCFVPLITGMSGNIGIQCSTVLVRGMATGLFSPGNRRETVWKELMLGFMAGGVFGVLCGAIVCGLDIGVSAVAVGVTVGVGLMGACLAGTLLGVFSPLFFARIGVDPAVAAGPIITAFNDFLSMSIYFLIALGLSRFFS